MHTNLQTGAIGSENDLAPEMTATREIIKPPDNFTD
jgi:hypothetical protein